MTNLLEFIISLGFIKKPFGLILGLNFIPILLGFFYLLINSKNIKLIIEDFKNILPLLILIGTGLISILYYQNFDGFLRLGQLFGFILFTLFIKLYFSVDKLKKIAIYLSTTLFILMVVEILYRYGGSIPEKNFFGFLMKRYEGGVGESNYSGIVASISICIILKNKYFKSAIFLFFFFLFTLISRTFLLIILSYLFFEFIYLKLNTNKASFFTKSLLFIIFTFPFLLLILTKTTSGNYPIYATLEKISNGRILLFFPYVELGFDNWLIGGGYFRSQLLYSEYLTKFIDLIKTYKINVTQVQQHNLFIQIWSDFGIVCYLFFTFFVFKSVLRIYQNTNYGNVFLALLVGLNFLNGLGEMYLFIFLGLSLQFQLLTKRDKTF